MDLSHLSVAIANRVGQDGRHTGPSEQDLVRRCRPTPESVVAGEQDFVALRIDGVDTELTAGYREGPGESGRETTRYILHDMSRQQVIEEFAPRGVGLGEGDDCGLTAVN